MSATMPRSPRGWILTAVFVGLMALLPLAASLVRSRPAAVCAADGVLLGDPPAACISLRDGPTHGFCCIGCARRWIASTGSRPATILVRDETSGRLIDAASAHYAWSPVVTQPATGDRLHAFALGTDARRHAAVYRGTLLSGRVDPFAVETSLQKDAP